MRGLGTLINLATVAGGGLIGIYAGHRLRDRTRSTIMQGLGLATIAVAIVGLEPLLDPDRGLRRAVILIAALTLGAILGEALGLEEKLEHLGAKLQRRFVRDDDEPPIPAVIELEGAPDPITRPVTDAPPPIESSRSFVEGFVVASTVFCVGPLTVLGALEDGLGVSIRLLAIKSTLDGIAVIGFASVYGWGALASLVTIAAIQGGLTALALVIDPVVTTEVLAQLGAIGSVLVFGIGLRLLELKHVRVVALSPALILGPVAAGLIDALL